MTYFIRNRGSSVRPAAVRYIGLWIDIVAMIGRIDSGDMHFIGNDTEPRLNLPVKMLLPTYLMISFTAVR